MNEQYLYAHYIFSRVILIAHAVAGRVHLVLEGLFSV